MTPRKYKTVFWIATVFCVISTLLSLCLGAVSLSVSQLWQGFLEGPVSTAGQILWFSRLPRTVACLLAGAAFAVSGAVIQGVLHNSLASPGIIGVNAGAGLAVTLCCAFGALSGWAIAGSAFLGAVAAVLLIVWIGQKTGASRTTVILSGVAVNAFLNALSEAVTTLVPEVSMLSIDFRAGGFASVSTVRLIPAGVLILCALAGIFTLCSELDVLALGEETAKSLGMRVAQTRTVFLFLAALLAGSAVSFAGLLGFVGLVVPHAARKLVGTGSRHLIPLCAVGGAGFITACDLFSRLVFTPYEVPVGILMAVLGGPFFLLLLTQRKGDNAHA